MGNSNPSTYNLTIEETELLYQSIKTHDMESFHRILDDLRILNESHKKYLEPHFGDSGSVVTTEYLKKLDKSPFYKNICKCMHLQYFFERFCYAKILSPCDKSLVKILIGGIREPNSTDHIFLESRIV